MSANGFHLREDWLNDAVKVFVVLHPQRVLRELSHLKIYVPEPDYLLAMKILAARVEGTDQQDVKFLIGLLNLKTPQEVFAILEKYYPNRQRSFLSKNYFPHDDFARNETTPRRRS